MASRGMVDARHVQDTNQKQSNKQSDGATRLLVLWVCWVALAVFLVAAGVVGFR